MLYEIRREYYSILHRACKATKNLWCKIVLLNKELAYVWIIYWIKFSRISHAADAVLVLV